jgi:hypothetical protein
MRRFLTVPVLVVLASLLSFVPPAGAADSPVGGTYVKKTKDGKPEIAMSVEAWGPGKVKLTWHIKIKGTDTTMSVVSAADGKDAEVLVGGKPTGEMMAIKLVDKYHTVTVVKMNGQLFGTSKGTFSNDYKTLTVENDFAQPAGGKAAGKTTEVWVRQ